MLRDAGHPSTVQQRSNSSTSHEPVGKHALTDVGPVQPKGEASGKDPAGVHAAAAAGVASPSGALPHQAHIQRLFGRHDVSGIQAHTGADAKNSADAMGAQAYATGNHVVLGDQADLHTVAHEAAHVVQQRGGVQLKGGVGEAGDGHEQHADAVADAVVAGKSAEHLLDGAAPGGGGHAASTGPVQHKLKHDGKLMSQASELGLAAGKTASAVVNTLLAAPATYYAPAAPDFEAPAMHVLEHKKYILGENHGDGTFATRTAKWPTVQTMKEAIKGMKAEGPAEASAIGGTTQDVRGTDKGHGLPLEDSHAYTMTRMVLQQQMLNNFDNLMLVPDGRNLVQDGLAEVAVMISNYADVGLAWCQQNGGRPADGTRGAHFMGVGFDNMVSDVFKQVIIPVAQKKAAPTTITKAHRIEIQKMLQTSVTHLMALIDTRPLGGGFMGMGKSKQGPDPIPNRADVTALATPGAGSDMPKAIESGHPAREAAMIENIKAAPAPLFVQIGDNHVDRVTAGVGAEAVAVKVGTDFDAMTRKA